MMLSEKPILVHDQGVCKYPTVEIVRYFEDLYISIQRRN